MLVDSRRALLVSGGLLAGATGIGVLVTLPATADAVQAVDDAVWRFAGAIRNRPRQPLIPLLGLPPWVTGWVTGCS